MTIETRCHPKPVVNATCLLGNKGCYENGKCHYMGNCEHKVLTNADRIRSMSDEELSVFLWELEKEEIARATEYALERRKITEWLKQPAEE